jgi:hypothetical protein
MSIPHVLSNLLFTLLHWVLDSACTFLSLLILQFITFSDVFFSLSFILYFATTLFVLTTGHTEHLHWLLN